MILKYEHDPPKNLPRIESEEELKAELKELSGTQHSSVTGSDTSSVTGGGDDNDSGR